MRAAGKIKAQLEAIYGPRRDVTEYATSWVLQELAAQADESRLADLVNHKFQKLGQHK